MTTTTKLTRPPHFGEPRKDQLAQILHYLLLLTIIISGGFALLAAPFSTSLSGPLISAGMAIISIALFICLRLKYLRFVSVALIVSAYCTIMLSLYVNGGIRDEANLVLITLLAMAGFLLGRQGIMALGILTTISLVLLYVAELNGLLIETEHYSPAGFDELLIALIAVTVATFIVHRITTQIFETTNQMQQQSNALQQKNRQLQDAQASLEKRTKELTATLTGLEDTQNQLIKAKEEAEAANQAKSEFLSKISHDLRTPLNSIQGFVSLLQTTSTEHEQELLTHIQRNSEHLLHLINDLLDISRIEARELTLHATQVSLIPFLHETIAFLQMSAQEMDLTLTYHVDEDLPQVIEADEHRLRQILTNLLGNALKFTQEGIVSLRVSKLPESSTENASCLRFEVIDTGIGIAAEDLLKIFTPFSQVGTESSRLQGTGLGLAISDRLIQAMGGQLHVESELNHGSRFWFDLCFTHKPAGGSEKPSPDRVKSP